MTTRACVPYARPPSSRCLPLTAHFVYMHLQDSCWSMIPHSIAMPGSNAPCRQWDPARRLWLLQRAVASRAWGAMQAREAKLWGVVLGTLGRQGNPRVFEHLCQALQGKQLPYIQVSLLPSVAYCVVPDLGGPRPT